MRSSAMKKMPIDLVAAEQWMKAERVRREECYAGLRPWKFPPGTNAQWPNGLAGLNDEEAAMLARLEASAPRRRG